MSSVVYVNQPSGILQMREYTRPDNPRTPAQQAWRQAIAKAGRAWQQLTPEQAKAWGYYAASLVPPGQRPPLAVNVFVQLTARILSLNPEAEIPTAPPTSEFGGDGVNFTVEGVAGGVTFVPDRANTAGAITELLIQPLACSHNNAYRTKYRVKGRAAFGPAVTVPARRGWYACAVRFVRQETGQSTAIIEVGRVYVP